MIFGKSAVAVVSGGASGLGAATARKFASMGLRIGIFDVNVAGGEALAEELGGVFQCVDVADPAASPPHAACPVSRESSDPPGAGRGQHKGQCALPLAQKAGGRDPTPRRPHPCSSSFKVLELVHQLGLS